jgi:cytochrome c-type biogenesis protein CcmH
MNAATFRLGRAATLVALSTLFAAPAVAQRPAPAAQHEQAKPTDDFSEHVEGAEALEGRIIAPCCWTQTIDIHGSEISTELRREIRQRLKAGESQETITADLVNRYGERILAVPPGNPLKDVGVLLSLAFGLAGIGAGAMLLRWRKRSQAERAAELDKDGEPKKKRSKKRDRYDDEIDAELEKL